MQAFNSILYVYLLISQSIPDKAYHSKLMSQSGLLTVTFTLHIISVSDYFSLNITPKNDVKGCIL